MAFCHLIDAKSGLINHDLACSYGAYTWHYATIRNTSSMDVRTFELSRQFSTFNRGHIVIFL